MNRDIKKETNESGNHKYMLNTETHGILQASGHKVNNINITYKVFWTSRDDILIIF